MKPTQGRKISVAVFVISLALLAATFVLPDIKLPQTVQQTVPPGPSSPPSYQVYGYGIPPVVNGSEINVTVSGYTPYELEYSLSPTIGNRILAALAYGTVGNGSAYSFGATAQDSYSLELTIISYNGSGYTIQYTGVWSPFSDIVVYTAPAVFLVAASLVATYYFGTRIPRQRSEEEVEKELEEIRRGRAG